MSRSVSTIKSGSIRLYVACLSIYVSLIGLTSRLTSQRSLNALLELRFIDLLKGDTLN